MTGHLFRNSVFLALTICTLVFSGNVLAAQGDIVRTSVNTIGGDADNGSGYSDVSADGRYVVFLSYATDLVAGDTNGKGDIFVRDMNTNITTRVSVSTGGVEANAISEYPSISADGRYVTFLSGATNLVAVDTNGKQDVFRHDRITGTTILVSVSTGDTQGNDHCLNTNDISADGRYVVFYASATNLVTGDGNGVQDVFVRDVVSGTTTRVSVSTGGGEGDAESIRPKISADGQYVVFVSGATNLVAGDTNGKYDVFRHDRTTGTTTRVSVDSAGTEANHNSDIPNISADGQYVSFQSYASNLVAGDTNGFYDVFVRDMTAGTTTMVSIDSAGFQADESSSFNGISGDGRYVVFESDATNLVAGDTNAKKDVFVHDRTTGTTSRVSVSSAGVEGDGLSNRANISKDGRYVVFDSAAANLVTGDGNAYYDTFRYDYLGAAPVSTPTPSAIIDDNGGASGGCFIRAMIE